MARRRILEELRLDKIAAVDKPCQEGATMTIMKRAPDADLAKDAEVDKARFETVQKQVDALALAVGVKPTSDAARLESLQKSVAGLRAEVSAVKK